MKKGFVIKDLDNGKYYTGKYWSYDEAWTREMSYAKKYVTIENIENLVINQELDDDCHSDYDELEDKFIEIVTVFSR